MTTTTLGHLSWAPSAHLGMLLSDIERLASLVSHAVSKGSTAPDLWNLAVIASCRLDGSAMTAVPDSGDVATVVTEDSTPLEVMRREYVGVANALGADDLAVTLARDPLKGLPALHRLITAGLVEPGATGQLRRSDQAVHDGAEGRIVFRPIAPADISTQLPLIREIVGAKSLHPVVTAGLVQFELLRLHPFESANGRLARVAARLILRNANLDPGGLAVAEVPMSGRRVGNYDAVAAALRSHDVTVWLETWAEDVVAGLRLATTALHIDVPVDPELDLDTALEGLPAQFTLADLRDSLPSGSGDGLELARRTASALADTGRVTPRSGSRGLRMRRGGPELPGWHNPHEGVVTP